MVDLKVGEFTPEFAGKMNFYLSAVDELLRRPQDSPTIGLILCKTRNHVTVEYALRNTATPIGVAEFVTALPAALAESLPSIEQIEVQLSGVACGASWAIGRLTASEPAVEPGSHDADFDAGERT